MRAILVLIPLFFTACMFTGVSAEERLRDAVVGINDEMRWNRIDLAAQRVAPPYRGHYRLSHHSWHREFQIADTEIIHVEIGEERATATSMVAIRWYDHRTMLLAETTLRQKWSKVTGGYVLINEEVASGNERLLAIPEGLLDIEGSTESETDSEPPAPAAEPSVTDESELAAL